MIKQVCFLLIGVLLSTTVLGQSPCYFLRNYDDDNSDNSGQNLLVNYDGEYVILTRGWSNTDDVRLISLNACGDTLRTREYVMSPGNGGEFPVNIFQNSDSSYTILGSQYVAAEGNSSSFILNVSKNGDSLSHHIINIGNNDNTESCIALGNKQYVCTGKYNLALPDASVFIYKTDSAGNIIWQHDHGYPDGYSVYKLIQVSDGGFVISGRTRDSSSYRFNHFLMKTDSTGHLLWQQIYHDTLNQFGGSVTLTHDSGFLITGSEEYQSLNGTDDRAVVMKTDSAGNLQWRKLYSDPSGSTGFGHSIEDNYGNFIILSGAGDTMNTDIHYIRIVKLNSQGDLLWSRDHTVLDQPEIMQVVGNFMLLDNGDILASGTVVTFSATRNDVLVIKMDSCGYSANDTSVASFSYIDGNQYNVDFQNTTIKVCSNIWYFGDGDSSTLRDPNHTYTDTGSYTVTLITQAGNTTDTVTQTITIEEPTGTHSTTKSEQFINIYPNPAGGAVTLKLSTFQPSTFQLYNLISQQVLNQPITQAQTCIPLQVPEGIYVYKLLVSGSAVKTGKLVVAE